MKFEEGAIYTIDYGVVSKLATFLMSKDGLNLFRDSDGLFNLSDTFLLKGRVKVTAADTDF
ncbi:hypothetical protein [Paenibacillus campinasensis]|uniref:Uncharacterized protein n=1 Tax=Paenibacillus campinasensis TaxID=66347 RepID=A0A268EIC8_9BACL|nr:hypothetical protein [Paenibacillus campinasensis]PAD72824.1 hypothetical protein CHH67_21180 [Paenibacillus campinasensis]